MLYRAGNVVEAEIVKGMLLSNNIEAHVSGFYLQGGIGEIAPSDFAKVHVPDEDYERARELIREYEQNQGVENTTAPDIEHAESTLTGKMLVAIIIIFAITVLGYWLSV